MRMKLVTIIGARPQFIKAATVSRAIAEYNKAIKDNIIKTYPTYILTSIFLTNKVIAADIINTAANIMLYNFLFFIIIYYFLP